MSALPGIIAGWLLDFYVSSGLLLLVVAALLLVVRQPVRRMALSWSAIVGLFVLATLCALPTWPRFAIPMNSISSVVPDDSAATSPGPRPEYERTTSQQDEPAIGINSNGLAADASLATPQVPSSPSPRRMMFAGIARVVPRLFLAGAFSIAVWQAFGAMLTHRLRRSACPAPESLQLALMRHLGRRFAKSQVLTSSRINQAIAVGVLRPCVILPDRFLTSETSAALDAVLAHESAHLRNGDLRMLACLRLLLMVLFAQPLFWWLRARIRIDQELLADAAAGSQVDVAEYAEILLHWFRVNDTSRSLLSTATLGLWERPHLLKRRIAMLLDSRFRVEMNSPRSWRMLSWLVLAAAMLPLSVVTLRESNAVAAADDAKEAQEAAAKPDGGTYKSTSEALAAAVGFYRAEKNAEAERAVEAAWKLAPNDDVRLDVCDAMLPIYRRSTEVEKMFDACDFVMRHTDSAPKRSLTRTGLLGFAYERGKIDLLVKRYEKSLAKDSKDRTALYVLSELYDRVKRDPDLAAKYTAQLLAAEQAADDSGEVDVPTSAKLAGQYVRQKEYLKGAELFEKIAPLDESLAAWHWKEAALAWRKLGDKPKALAAAKKSAASPAEKRSEQLTHYLERALGEVFLDAGEPATAIPHLERAIETTKIEGYLDDCKLLLAKAREAAGNE